MRTVVDARTPGVTRYGYTCSDRHGEKSEGAGAARILVKHGTVPGTRLSYAGLPANTGDGQPPEPPMRPLLESRNRTLLVSILYGGSVMALAVGIRHVHGLFLLPITVDRGMRPVIPS